MENLVYIGKIIDLQPIEGADFIVSATVVCGGGGKWRGVVRKADFLLGDLCIVFLPDSQLDPDIHAYLPFMKDSSWRVKMRRFKGAPSEVLITGFDSDLGEKVTYKHACFFDCGIDITQIMRVYKYCKPIPAHLNGLAKGDFPGFIPKTDEPNYQSNLGLVDILVDHPYYITEKADGSSTTAYRWRGVFGVCSRNLDLVRNEDNGYWKVAIKHNLEENLPEGIALQWETCGPGIQANPMGLDEISGFAFSAYNISEQKYLDGEELICLCQKLGFPMCKIVDLGLSFSKEGVETLGEGLYANGKEREGVVVRSQQNYYYDNPISFKVINLNYEK